MLRTRMMLRQRAALPRATAWAVLACGFLGTAAARAEFRVTPEKVALNGAFSQAQLLVTALQTGGEVNSRSADLTHKAIYLSSNPQVVSVNETGRLKPVTNGEATIQATFDGTTHAVNVQVSGITPEPQVSFSGQILPILSKAGCNAGACHASQYGKGGFKLSVFGFAPDEDHRAIVRDLQGRRANLLQPEESLVLLKPTRAVPHGGNLRLEAGSHDYQTVLAWLACGAPPPNAKEPPVASISVEPRSRVGDEGFEQQLQVTATYADGRVQDVTAWAKYDSLDDSVVQVTPEGLCRNVGRGQAAVMVRFEGQAEITSIVSAYHTTVDLADWRDNNYIDRLAAEKFRELGIKPSPLCDDATFLRRAYLDAVGTLPRLEETREFLASANPDKRKHLVDCLLGLTGDPKLDVHNNEYSAFWSLKWADLIRSSSITIGEQGMWALHNWLQESFRDNKPFDQFVRELLTANGSIYMNGPANYYRVAGNPPDLAETTAQLFLGVRLQCAKCHHHPFEKYSQADYYGFAACFARVGTKNSSEFGLFGREQVVMVKSDGEVNHPKTGKPLPPTTLDGQPIDAASVDRRQPLAQWLASADNRLFARNVVNRYMAYLLGRGIVEPVDDLRETNPASNVALFDAMSAELVKNRFNLKLLVRDIMNSRLYQLESQPTDGNAADSRFYSHFRVKRIPAEALLDAIDYVTLSPTKFDKLPMGTRAIDLPDANYANVFLKTFGKPLRASVCECERVSDPNLSQALSTLNGDVLATKISDAKGRVARLIGEKKSFDEIVGELYLATLCRPPSGEELATSRAFLEQAGDPQIFYEDLLWTLINSKQFLFVR